MRTSIGTMGLILLVAPLASPSEGPPVETNAAAALKKLGVKIIRDDTKRGRPVVAIKRDLGHRPDADADEHLMYLQSFPTVWELDLQYAGIFDKGLQHLTGLPNLRHLRLSWNHITDKGMVYLNGLTNLQSLDLGVTDVTDAGLQQLTGLKNLQVIYLTRESITDKGVDRLCKALPKLRVERGNGNTAQKRIRRHFSIPETAPLTEEAIRDAIVAKTPLGSSAEDVYSYLKASAIGKDDFSAYYPLEDTCITCRIDFDPASGFVVHTHYCILFKMNEKERLKKVEVKIWLTGP